MSFEHVDINPGQESYDALVALLRTGDIQAFNQLFFRYHKQAVAVAQGITNDIYTAEEAVSDVFLSIWGRRSELPATLNFAAYFLSAVRYAALHAYKKKKTQPTQALDDYQEQAHHSPPTPNYILKETEMSALLNQAIDNLPAQRRIIFILKKKEGLSAKAIAALLQLSERTVEKQVSLPRQRPQLWRMG